MGLRDRVRVFSLRYRKVPGGMIREPQCNCDRWEDGVHQAGDIWHVERGEDVWVNLMVEHFENPAAEEGLERFDQLFGQCEQAADRYVQARYPGVPLRWPDAADG